LQNPPLLMSFVFDNPLILYLTTTKKAMGCILWKHDESGRKKKGQSII
jgi:hypothetical protein